MLITSPNYWEAKFPLQKKISSCLLLLPKKGGYYSKTSQCELMNKCMCPHFLVEIWVWNLLPCSSNKPSLPYMVSIQEWCKFHSPLGFHCKYSYLSNDAKALWEPRLMGVVRCGWTCFGNFTLKWGQHQGLGFAIYYSKVDIFVSWHLILNAYSDLSSIIIIDCIA